MKKIICGEENVKEFNRQLKEVVPEFYDLVKQLYQAGLIDGLRGATLEIHNDQTPTKGEPQKTPPAQK